MTKLVAFLRTMAGQIFMILLVGIVLSATVALALADGKRRSDLDRVWLERATDRAQYFFALLDRASGSARERLVNGSEPGVRSVAPASAQGAVDRDLTGLLVARLGPTAAPVAYRADFAACFAGVTPRQLPPRPRPIPSPSGPAPFEPPRGLPEPDWGPPQPGFGASGMGFGSPQCWIVAARLADGAQVALAVDAPPRLRDERRGFDFVYLGVLAGAAAVLALLVARMAARPWNVFARAAGELGRNLDRPPLVVGGVEEVREMAQAFNSMQADLKRHVSERTQMLAAITHDLQTPLTRIRLRLEKVQDETLRERLIDDLMAMENLVREGLDLASAEQKAEPPIVLDFASLIESIAEDAADAGRPVTLGAVAPAYVQAGPVSLRRCIENLVDNAIAYGGEAEIASDLQGDCVRVTVRDRGPGIPEGKIAAVLEPFVRLEASRSRETGGSGLGLAIASRLADQNGARLTLKNHPDGGLEASLLVVRQL